MHLYRYRLIDVAREIDRDKSTIIRWEELGLISEASRDSRGWRYYDEEQVKKIIDRVRSTNYFKQHLDTLDPPPARPIQRAVFINHAQQGAE